MPDLIASMERALAAYSAGEVEQPVRTVLTVGDGHSFFALMPAWLRSEPALGAKLVTVYHSNLAKGLPSHLATILLLDPDTGALAAVMDGRYITEARTAAVSAVSAAKLAREDAATLAVLGSGVQAYSHVQALRQVRPLREIRAWSPTAANLAKFCDSTGALPAASAEEAVRGAAIIALVTSSSTPVIEHAWVTPGAHVVSVGACRPNQREMDPELVAASRLFVDCRKAALVESGDVVQGIREGWFSEDDIAGELGQVISGRVPGRETSGQITVFKSLGLAVEDVAAAHLVLDRARKLGRGKEI